MDTTGFRQVDAVWVKDCASPFHSCSCVLLAALGKESAVVQLEEVAAFARGPEASCQRIWAMRQTLWCAKVMATEL